MLGREEDGEPAVGHLTGDYVHKHQPAKFAAIEARWVTEQPAREVLIANGDFDPVAAKAQLKALFGDWRSAKPHAPVRTHYNGIAARAARLETPDKANAVVLARANLSLNDNDPEYPALLVANNVFGGGSLSSRLGDRLRQKDGLSYNVGSSIVADSAPDGRDDDGQIVIQAIAAPENVTRLDAALREELARFVRDGITAEELKTSVNSLLTQRRQNRANDGSIAGLLARNLYMGRTMAWAADFESKLEALTVDDVNAAIRKHIKPETLSLFAAGDFAKAEKK